MVINRRNHYIFSVVTHLVFILLCLFCILPILLVLAISLSTEQSIANHGYSLLPREFSIMAYVYIFQNAKPILIGYGISISTAFSGTLLSLLFTSMIAYPLSRYDFIFRKKISFFVFFTMLFSSGLVPWYMVITKLQIQNTFLVLVVPYLVAAWNVLLLRTYFQSISMSIIESAKIDGASEFRTYFSIILPLSKPALATIGLLICYQYWNDYLSGLLFIHNPNLVSIQFLLYRIMSNLEFYTKNASVIPAGMDVSALPKLSARMAMCVIVMTPVLCVFPFFQKHFVKGLIVGSVKG